MPPLAASEQVVDAGWHVVGSPSPSPTRGCNSRCKTSRPLTKTKTATSGTAAAGAAATIKKTTKSVVFSNTDDEIITTQYTYDFSDKIDINSLLWYNKDEYEKIKKERDATLKKYSAGKPILEEKGHCMRGLEAKTKFGCRRRRNFRTKALNVVWETQIGQWKSRTDDQRAIATTYKAQTIACRYRAIESAYYDAQYVKNRVS